jgi:hypothetical protein
MEIKFTYDTYQDVRHNLFLYSIPVLVIAGFFAYFWILPLSVQNRVTHVVSSLASSPVWKEVLGGVSGIAFFAALAFLMTEILQVHDQYYDRFVIKWRFRYATDFILPRLTQPFSSFLNYRFYEEAEGHIRQFQERLYYPFVGDRDLKIPKKTLVRFYEVVTLYWLTQINEIVLILLVVMTLICRFVGPADSSYRTQLLSDLLIIIGMWILNRIWIRAGREKVRRATEDEIAAIHDDEVLKRQLGEKLRQLCVDYSIPYVSPQD